MVTTTEPKPEGRRWVEFKRPVIEAETHCGICGEWVDKELHHHDRMSATVDHIIPVAMGGAVWDRANLRLAHRACNSRSGNRQAADAALHRLALARAAVHLGTLMGEGGSNPYRSRPHEDVGSSRVDLQACKLEYSIVSPK